MTATLKADLRKLAKGNCQRLRITENEAGDTRVVFRNLTMLAGLRDILLSLDRLLAKQEMNYTRPFTYTTYDTDRKTVITNATFRVW